MGGLPIAHATVFVTGASSGIGAATAKAMAGRGARVGLFARTRNDLEAVAAEIAAARGTARVYPVDLTDGEAALEAFGRARAHLGRPAVLVNSAGAGRWLFLEETSPAEAVQMMALPYFAAFNATCACLPDMLRAERGCIVNVESPASRVPWPGATGYTAARWALRGLTEALRADLWGTPVRVLAVVPGVVDTAYFARNRGVAERLPRISRLVRTLDPHEVAAAIVRGVERGRREVVLPLMLRLLLLCHALAPWPVERVVRATGWRRPR